MIEDLQVLGGLCVCVSVYVYIRWDHTQLWARRHRTSQKEKQSERSLVMVTTILTTSNI